MSVINTKKIRLVTKVLTSCLAFYLFFIFSGCTKKEKDYIVSPTSDFEMVYDTTHPAPVEIAFINKSIYASSYVWTFDDGTFSEDENPVHVFNTGGVYKIELSATGGGGQDNKKYIIKIDDQFTIVRITNIEITNLPLTTVWDSTDGPDVYIKVIDSTNYIAYDGELHVTPNVTSASFPIVTDLSLHPIITTDFWNSIMIKVFDQDSPSPDQVIGIASFKPDYLMKNEDDPYPDTLHLDVQGIAVTVALKWTHK